MFRDGLFLMLVTLVTVIVIVRFRMLTLNKRKQEMQIIGTPKSYMWDPDRHEDYGVFICEECGRGRIHNLDTPIHKHDCSVRDQGIEACVYVFGPTQLHKVIEIAGVHGEDYQWFGISVSLLRKLYPGLLPMLEVTGD